MNKVILCEGMTDAILLSYYLGKVAGWVYNNKPPANIAIREDDNESVNWYKKNNDLLLICSVGGKDRMADFFRKKILSPIVDAGAFSRLAIVLDRDDNDIRSIETRASNIFHPVITQMKNNEWIKNDYKDSYGRDQLVESLLIVIPTEHQGALETVMLESISEDPYDAEIVKRAGIFVREMKTVASKYIKNDRKELKAHLGVTWAIQYPEKVFRLINEQIQSVEWEKSAVLHQCFEQLIKI